MGKITKIEIQKRNKERVNIYIDNVYSFAVNAELVYKEHLSINAEIDEEKLKRIAAKDNLAKCKNTALRIVEKSYKTEKEIYDRLVEKGYEKESIDSVIEFLKEYKFINDETYVKMYTKDRIKKQGINKIKYALKRKGIEEEKIEEVLSQVSKDDEKVVAKELAIKKYKMLSKKENDKYKLWNKLCRFLVGKGYDYSLSKEVIKEITSIDEEF